MTQGVVTGPTPKKTEGRMALGVATAMPMLRAAQVFLTWENVMATTLPAYHGVMFQHDLQHLKRAMQRFADWADRENAA